jgi:hypothetical protein
MKPIKQVLSFSKKIIIIKKENIISNKLKMKFRKNETYFTRNRKLTFENMIILMLQKWVKSLQLRLNEFSLNLWKKLDTITASAYVQAKNKISYKLFLYLNLEIIINLYYNIKENEAWYETWNDFRLLATDGSQIRLPEEKEIKEKYWTTKIKNSKWNQWEYSHWLLSVIYDPLNNLAIDSILERWDYSERALAIQNVINVENTIKIKEKDLLLYDRWYYSSFIFATMLSYQKEVLFRIRKWACKKIDELFEKDCKINSKTITIKVENKEKEYEEKYWIKLDKKIKDEVKIRFIRIVLNTWEIEILATSLLDEIKYKVEIFSDLYFQRWWVEVYYDILKNRLWLENFTWKNIESVLQDLHSTIYLSNYETVMTRAHNMKLELKTKQKNLRNKQKVNKQVSFNIIKNRVMDLFLNDRDVDEIIDELNVIFNTNTTQERELRTNSRKKTTTTKSLNFNKRKKKSCF